MTFRRPVMDVKSINAALILFGALCLIPAANGSNLEDITFKRVPLQFIAALGDPGAMSGDGAETWGIWELDPGPRGVWLDRFDKLEEAGGVAPSNWQFDGEDWWLEEHGLIMEKPAFPLPPGRYLVTGDREVTTMLEVFPDDDQGNRRWELAHGTLFDVTHLPCRSARYTPIDSETPCTPANASQANFPVVPGATMPAVPGCHKQDYAVLFIIAVAVES